MMMRFGVYAGMACAALALCGCISSAPKAADNWSVEFWRAGRSEGDTEASQQRGAVRLSNVTVRAPYDGIHLAVLRADGTIAYDPYNAFAAAPAQLLRGAVQDAVEDSGRFSRVLAANSGAKCDLSLEVTVTRVALDCRKEGRRDATIELTLLLIEGREAVASGKAEGKAATSDGDYSAAFSRALAKAVSSALAELETKR